MASESVVSQVQRKIELQSQEDLSYLVGNVRAAAAAELDKAFPYVAGHQGDNDLRNQVEKLVNDYIEQTFTLASPNLTINGMPISASQLSSLSASADAETEQAYQPFDSRKRERVAELTTQEEKLLEEVAALKRSVPKAAAADHVDRIRDGIKSDEELLEKRTSQVTTDAAAGVRLSVDKLDRQDGVEEGFRRAVDALGRLKRDMPSVVARMERARVAGEYVASDAK